MPAVLRNRALWLFVLAYCLSVGVLAAGGRPLEDTIGVLVIFGLGLPALGLLCCLRLPSPGTPAPPLRHEALILLALLLAVTLFLAVKGDLLGSLLPAVPDPRWRNVVNTLLKVAAFVAVPALVLRLAHGAWPTVGAVTAGRARLGLCFLVLGVIAVAVQFVVGTGARQLLAPEFQARHWVLGALLCFAWMSLEAGLVEEFFFRRLLQSRLAALTGSQVSAVCLGALAFGLAHAPGFWLRGAGADEGLGAHPTLFTAAAYSIAMQGVVGLLFGVLWARTRSFALVVALHGLIDAAANAAGFMDTWKL
ncbi:MAG: family intrarane metalloprotease [Nevskia sp.]|nr:family intrarane metalloprotease [Nevskia sp.]